MSKVECRLRRKLTNERIKMTKSNFDGKRAIGKKEWTKFINAETLTYKETILANCYECTGFYDGGRVSCLIPNCAAYPYMPYRDIKIDTGEAS